MLKTLYEVRCAEVRKAWAEGKDARLPKAKYVKHGCGCKEPVTAWSHTGQPLAPVAVRICPKCVARIEAHKREDAEREKNMTLPEGQTCGTCVHAKRCLAFGFTSSAENTRCDFYPSRFHAAPEADNA